MPIISVSLSEELVHKLDEATEKRDRSRLIGKCIEAYFSPPHTKSESRELQDLQDKLNMKEQELAKTLDDIKKLQSENDSIKSKYEELAKASQEDNKSKTVVVTGLQHNLELKDAQIKALEHEIALQKDSIRELKDDKERLVKQNEVFTARLLPPPKKPLLTRLKERFGRKVEGKTTT